MKAVLIVAAATLSAITVAQAQTMAPQSSAPPPAASNSAKSVPAADRSFATKAAQAGLGEVAEAQVAAQKSDRQDVKDFAQRMITDHTKAGDQLKQVASGEGLSLPTSPSAADNREVAKLSKESGPTFDRDYIRAQRTAHKEAVSLFTKESKSGKDDNLKSFASDTLPTLQDHYKMVSDMPLTAKAQ